MTRLDGDQLNNIKKKEKKKGNRGKPHRQYERVSNKFFGIRDWVYLRAGIWEFKVRRERDAGLLL